jgi:hypothetical protein
MFGIGSARRWRQLLLLVGAITISLSVLAMHQLAVNHSFARPATTEVHATHDQGFALGMQQKGPTAHPATHDGVPRLAVAAGNANSCLPDCGAHHQVSVLSCLLALTLLMLSWLLAPPRECRQTFSAALRTIAGVVPLNNRRASLSLAELSVRRT